MSHSQQTQNICITFVQRRPSVFDVVPTLYKYYTHDLCLILGLRCGPIAGRIQNLGKDRGRGGGPIENNSFVHVNRHDQCFFLSFQYMGT